MSAYHGDVDSCPECGTALCSNTCWSCGGTPPSWFCMCEECGGRGQLLVCPACLPPPRGAAERNYWCGSAGQFSDPFCGREHERAFILHRPAQSQFSSASRFTAGASGSCLSRSREWPERQSSRARTNEVAPAHARLEPHEDQPDRGKRKGRKRQLPMPEINETRAAPRGAHRER
jgi:hypothetical protein